MTTGQLIMPATVPGSYTVQSRTVQGWENGGQPQPEKRLGTLLKRGQVERVDKWES